MVLLLALAALVSASVAADVPLTPSSGAVDNKLIARVPFPRTGPATNFTFVQLPRTVVDAKKDDFTIVEDVSAKKDYSLWCQDREYTMCLMFDRKGSIAGIQISTSLADLARTKNPINYAEDPHWIRQTVMGQDVYSSITLFVKPSVLAAGGRTLTETTPTAPDGVYFLKTSGEYLNLPIAEEGTSGTGFYKQGCVPAMGRHYNLELTPESDCKKARSLFTLYGEQSKKLIGYGVYQHGTPAPHSTWFELFQPENLKEVVPNSPPCSMEYLIKYHTFVIHIFFTDNPRGITC